MGQDLVKVEMNEQSVWGHEGCFATKLKPDASQLYIRSIRMPNNVCLSIRLSDLKTRYETLV